MTTSVANLDVTQYVKINQGLNSILLQAHRDAVRIAFSDLKPAKGNTAFHILGGDDAPLNREVLTTDVWALATTECASLTVTETVIDGDMTSAFGEKMVAQATPLTQVTAQYGILSDMLTVSTGGSVDTVDSKFRVSSGTDSSGVSAAVSMRQAQYKAGQGLSCEITALFTQGVANNVQQAGFLTSESAFCFGYNGTEYGILHSRGGELENQELTITSPAVGAETATVTVDSVVHLVPLTTTTVEGNAYEISEYLNDNVNGYDFTSNNDKVFALAQLPDFGAGTFSFSSATCSATWVEVTSGVNPVETWIPKADWNVRPDIDIDPTKGNVYKIQVQYLGFGGIRFFRENRTTAAFELVHVIRYADTDIIPSVSNPIFRVGWATRNTGNTTNVVVQGSSAGSFIEGIIKYDGIPRGACNTQPSVGVPSVGVLGTNVIGFRNRLTFNETANRAEIIPLILSLATDSNKIAIFQIVANPIPATGSIIEWQFVDENLSLMEFTNSNVDIIGGQVVSCLNVSSVNSKDIDMQKLLEFQSPNTEFAIVAGLASSGTSANMTASGTWKEDL